MNLQSHLFTSFFRRQPLAARLNWIAWGAALAAVIVALTFLNTYQIQTALIDGLSANALSDAQVQAYSSQTTSILFLGTGLGLFLMIAGGALSMVTTHLLNRDYARHVAQLDSNTLTVLAKGLETDETSRQFFVRELTHREPGWSYTGA